MEKILMLVLRNQREGSDEILAVFNEKEFTAEKLLKFFRQPSQGLWKWEKFEPLSDDKLQELFSEYSVETWFGSYVINVMEIL